MKRVTDFILTMNPFFNKNSVNERDGIILSIFTS